MSQIPQSRLSRAPGAWALALLMMIALLTSAVEARRGGRGPRVTICAEPGSELPGILQRAGVTVSLRDDPRAAIEAAPPDTAVLLLAHGYPATPAALPGPVLAPAREKRLRLYLEWQANEAAPVRETRWERLLVSTQGLGPALPQGRILALPDCRVLSQSPGAGSEVWLASARVAGFDHAVYGIPTSARSVLFTAEGGRALVASTALSRVIRNRAAPRREWEALWTRILRHLLPGEEVPELRWEAAVRPAYAREDPLPERAEERALQSGAGWVCRCGLLLDSERASEVHKRLREGAEIANRKEVAGSGDGRFGVLEGYSSGIRWDGSQPARLPLRADCQAESAMVLAASGGRGSSAISRNLLEYLYRTSDLQGGIRADPHHPAFGLIAWGTVAPAWSRATYGDDEARVLLASAAASAWLKDRRWDASMLRALWANLRTTGRRGYRGDRIDFPDLERRGWKSYSEADLVNRSPAFEAYLWACNLWAYRATGDREFLDRTSAGIRDTMSAYPNGWRWGDNLDRCRMILPLAWLVRLEDTAEHREWLRRIAGDMLKYQQPSGALAEAVNEKGGGGHFHVPPTNEAYGTGETPLIQRNGDPVSDQLYTGGFALLGLHEAAAALDDPALRAAEDRLAAYLCRIQVRAPKHPYLDGAWFRGFDFGRWDYFASSGDVGWGPWCVETGWAPFWGLSTFALRHQRTSLWDLIGTLPLREHSAAVRSEMAENDGGPWRR